MSALTRIPSLKSDKIIIIVQHIAHYFSWCGHTVHGWTEETLQERDKQDVLEQKHDVAAQFEKGVGYTMSWSASSGLEMGTSSGTMYW